MDASKMLRITVLAALCVSALPAEAQSVRRSAQSSATSGPSPCRESRRAILKKARELRGELGRAVSRELDAKQGGRFVRYEHGFVYWRKDLGAHAVYGAIAEKWEELGREAFGFPISDEAAASDGARFSVFEGGKSIHWSEPTAAHALSGPIRSEWLANGGAAGGLGNPQSDPYQVGAHLRSDFEFGYVMWFSDSGATLASVQERCVQCADGSAECGVGALCASRGVEVSVW
jgi:uncharacterized protein with LGFP repeats